MPVAGEVGVCSLLFGLILVLFTVAIIKSYSQDDLERRKVY